MIANAYDLKTTVEQVSGCKQKFDKAWTCLKIKRAMYLCKK